MRVFHILLKKDRVNYPIDRNSLHWLPSSTAATTKETSNDKAFINIFEPAIWKPKTKKNKEVKIKYPFVVASGVVFTNEIQRGISFRKIFY